MNEEPPESIISLAKRRRLRRTLEFLAATMGTRLDDTSPAPAHRFGDLKPLSRLPIDVAAVRAVPPKMRRELLAHVRRRQRGCILARLRDPVEGVADAIFDFAAYDVGVAILHDLSLYYGAGWWLVGRPGEVLFRLTHEGRIPTLTPPWAYAGISAADAGRQRWRGVAAAEQLLGSYVWSV